MRMIPVASLADRLQTELQVIEDSIIDLWQKSEIEEFRNDPSSALFFVRDARYYWQQLSSQHRPFQAAAINRYRRWFEVFSRCCSRYSSDIQGEIKDVNEYVVSALELNTAWATEATREDNQKCLTKNLAVFRGLLRCDSAEPDSLTEYIVIPDTNSLLQYAEPRYYRNVVDSKRFSFCIVPTVLSELDGLKRNRAGQQVGEKAEKAIRIIKGFRQQGSVLDGVIVDKTIIVRMVATEPRAENLPSWLDLNNKDDAILGSALEIQFENPSTVVVLVTGDINLQNKAEMAFLPYSELPDFPTQSSTA